MDTLSVEVLDLALAKNSTRVTIRQSSQSSTSNNAQVCLPTTMDLVQPMCSENLPPSWKNVATSIVEEQGFSKNPVFFHVMDPDE
jgi:hypothetical protein